jgi:thiamine pyrophosphokinase
MKATTAILADGEFPFHPASRALLRRASRIVCCDGAVVKLTKAGFEPAFVIGDLDSLPAALRKRWADRVIRDPGQADNDLSKAFRFCLSRGWTELALLGATGLREDHTLGNISLLADFAARARVRMVTNYGEFVPLLKSGRIPCRPGQAVSVFSLDPRDPVSSRGLQYPLKELKLSRWWQASLNVAEGRSFEIRFKRGPVVVYLAHSRTPAGKRA